MKKFGLTTWGKMLSVFLSLLLGPTSAWLFWSQSSIFVVFVSVGMLALSLYCLINPFVYRLIVDDDFVVEKTLFKEKQIFFNDITHVNLQGLFAEIGVNRKKISLSRFGTESYHEILRTVISQTKDKRDLWFAGDPILLQSYANGVSDDGPMSQFFESKESLAFTFVENAKLIEKHWLFRMVEITTTRGVFRIAYYGREMGYECVFVNDELVAKKDSSFWYVPTFEFSYAGMSFSVNVRIYPWFTIRRFWIELDNRVVYSE